MGNEYPAEPSVIQSHKESLSPAPGSTHLLSNGLSAKEPSGTHLSIGLSAKEPRGTHLSIGLSAKEPDGTPDIDIHVSAKEPDDTHLSIGLPAKKPGGTHHSIDLSAKEPGGTHHSIDLSAKEPGGTHHSIDVHVSAKEPSGTHLSIGLTAMEPGGTQWSPVSTSLQPSKAHSISSPTCTTTLFRTQPLVPKVNGTFARHRNPADNQKSRIPRDSSSRIPSIVGLVTDAVAGIGTSGSRYLLVSIIMPMVWTVILPLRLVIPESIRAGLLSPIRPWWERGRTHCRTPEHTPGDDLQALGTMSGQLCFLTRYGPFNDSQDDEVTFQAPEEGSDEVDSTGGTDAKSALLVERQSSTSVVGSPTPPGSDSSTSSDGSCSSQESLTDGQAVPIGKLWLGLGRFFNSTIASVVILLLTVAASLTLAWVGVFVVGETPYFDKSLKAFQIPNHISTRRQQAFEAAQRDIFHDVGKRSLDYAFRNWDAGDGDALESHVRQTDSTQQATKTQSNSPAEPFKSRRQKVDRKHVRMLRNERQDTERALSRARRATQAVYRSMKWRVELLYMAKGPDQNIFTKDRLKTIHKVELSIMKHKNFTDFCSRDRRSYSDPALEPYNYCTPLNSLMTYFYPSEVDGKIVYDGVGSNLADINGTLSHAMLEPTFYWFVDTTMNSNNRWSKFMRSEIWFGTPLGDGTAHLTKEDISVMYKDFLISYIDLLDKASTDKVRVLYGGPQLFDYEVEETIAHDLRLSIPAGIAILLLLFILTSFSVWLTLWGFASILFSFAWAYFVYHVAFGKAALGLLNVFSGFIIFGIGVDDVFVFVNTYVQAEQYYKDPVQRMAHTVKMAGVATFFTSFTTAGAFAANIASQIPAINDFGLFMCLIVSFCWFLVAMVMPCALTLWQRFFHCEVSMFRCCTSSADDPATAMATLSRVLDRHERQTSASETDLRQGPAGDQPRGLRDVDNDIPLLDLEEEADAQRLLADDDVPLILTNDDNFSPLVASSARPAPKQACSITKALQVFLYRYLAAPVIRGRVIVIFGYVMVLIASVVLVVHIKPAARPPALYNEDTNIQQLLDLAYNFSGKGITCKSCSGFSSASSGKQPVPSPGRVTLPPVLPAPTAERPKKTDRPAVTEPWKDEATTAHHGHADSIPPPVHTTPPKIHTSASHHQGADVTTAPVAKPTCAEANPTCRFASSCVDDAVHGPACRCVFNCPDGGDKVCGSNGQTYLNTCLLQRASCQKQQIIQAVYVGACYDPRTKSSGGSQSHTVKPGGDDSSNSPGSGYNPCPEGTCGNPADRPILDSTALVYVVFGVDHFERIEPEEKHVLQEDTGNVVYDVDFNLLNENTLRGLCKVCKNLAARTELVTPGGAQCFPSEFSSYISILKVKYEECRNLPIPNLLTGVRSNSMARRHGKKVVWFAMAFESTTFMGKSSFAAYKDYNDWELAISEAKGALLEQERPGLDTMFQTSKYWQQIFMEIVGVTSAIYGVAFSLLICVVAVVIFTAHIGILLIALLTIGGVIMVVISMFYLLGWEMGAVEAVSLSIIVGSSIDYCIHLIEGYLVAGDRVPDPTNKSAAQLRRWRTRHSIGTIGVSILSSALTTIIATVPLCFTTIQLFAKFGKIVAMNTFVSILYTLTACAALLSLAGPARYRWNLKWFLASALALSCLIAGVVAVLFMVHTSGVSIPGPSGNPLF